LQWLQEPSEISGDYLNKARREASGHFRKGNREFMEINELAMNRKDKNIIHIYI
jgi:hypothetical protein